MPTLEIRLTTHAVDRFHERVRPALTRAAAEDELARLVLFGSIFSEAPAWFAIRQRQRAAAYLVIGDLVLPLEPVGTGGDAYSAVTCIARGGISETARFRRNGRRHRRLDGWVSGPGVRTRP